MANEMVLSVDDLKKQLAEISGGEVDEESKAVAGGSNMTKRISIKGGVFRKIAGGKEIAALPDRFMHVIFAKMAPHPSRMLYPEAYVEGKKTSPICWSTNSEVPDISVEKPQSTSCRNCPMNIKGSAADGKSKACRISWRTAVVLPNDPSGDVMQLVIPGASAWGDEHNRSWPFHPYVKYLVENGISVGRVITKMEFDLRKPSPTLLFSPVAPVPKEMLEQVAQQNKSLAAMLATKLTVFQADAAAVEEDEETPATPAQAALPSPEVPEPVLRETAKPTPPAEKAELSDTIKKWASKKGS